MTACTFALYAIRLVKLTPDVCLMKRLIRKTSSSSHILLSLRQTTLLIHRVWHVTSYRNKTDLIDQNENTTKNKTGFQPVYGNKGQKELWRETQNAYWQEEPSRSELNHKIESHNLLHLQLKILQFCTSWVRIPAASCLF